MLRTEARVAEAGESQETPPGGIGPQPWMEADVPFEGRVATGLPAAEPGLQGGHWGTNPLQTPAPSVPQLLSLHRKTLTLLPGFPVGPGGPCTPRGPCPESEGKGSVAYPCFSEPKAKLCPHVVTWPVARPASCQLVGSPRSEHRTRCPE